MSSKSSTPTLKQSKLSFGASKSAAAVNKAKKDAVSQSSSSTSKRPTRAAAAKPSIVDAESSEEELNVDDIELQESEPSSESEIEKDEEPFPEDKRAKMGTAVKRDTRASATKVKAKTEELSTTPKPHVKPTEKEAAERLAEEVESRPNLNIKAKAYDNISKETKGKMAYAHTIHPTTEVDGKDVPLNRVDDILRIFDLTYEYGPCAGMTRLDRWRRANKLGLNPPAEIYDILMTKEGLTESRYSQNVLYGRI